MINVTLYLKIHNKSIKDIFDPSKSLYYVMYVFKIPDFSYQNDRNKLIESVMDKIYLAVNVRFDDLQNDAGTELELYGWKAHLMDNEYNYITSMIWVNPITVN